MACSIFPDLKRICLFALGPLWAVLGALCSGVALNSAYEPYVMPEIENGPPHITQAKDAVSPLNSLCGTK